MDTHDVSFRDLRHDEFDTPSILGHAAEQAVKRKYEDFCIIDVDSHHYETESMQEILEYMDDPVLQQLAKSASQSKRAGAGFCLQQSLKLSGGVAEVSGEARDTLAVHGAVGDQPHGPRDEVVANVPFRRARRRVRTAALTRAKASALRGRRSWKELHVTGERWPDRTAGAAIYPGGPRGGDEPAVEPSVLGLHGPVAAVEVFMHGSTITPDH